MPLSIPNLDRFKRAAMLIGGGLVNELGIIVERPGWLTYAAHYYGTDKSSLAKILSGKRTLLPEMEQQMMAAIQKFRAGEVHRHKQLVLLQVDYNVDMRQTVLEDLEEFTKDGPAPGMAG